MGAVPELAALLTAVHERAQPHALRSHVHGPRHWRDVARVGLVLARSEPLADAEVVFLCALLHDTCRRNDDYDPGHGPRAAALTDELCDEGLIALTSSRRAVLLDAVECHTSAGTTPDPTRGCCWDADRLTLWRVSMVPSPEYLSGELAQAPTTRNWSRRLLAGADRTWADIFAAFQDGRELDCPPAVAAA